MVENEAWTDGLTDALDPEAGSEPMRGDDNQDVVQPNGEMDTRRLEIVKAANTYLSRPVEIKNVAHAVHPIGRYSRHNQEAQPTLEVDLIVYGPSEDDEDSQDGDSSVVDDLMAESPSAKLMLVRMVNGVPLLDGAEAMACGLVQGIVQKQPTWNSFGLQVTSLSSDDRVTCWIQ